LSDDLGQGFQAAIQGLFDIGVPVVVSFGNNAPARPRMDRLPSILEADDFPIITVGAVDLNGSREPGSQGENQVAIYAPGVDVEAQLKHDKQSEEMTVTSLGKPIRDFSRTDD
jgi:electron transfer flavoprotein alpha/beta subunit